MLSRKRGKKGQSANEAMMLITMLTFFLIVTLAAVSDDLIRASDDNYKALLQDMADFIEQEAQIAFASENGYFHTFTLPQTLNGQPYAISIINSTQIGDQANTTILSIASTRPNVPLNVTRLLPRDVLGTLVIGPNTVKKEQGIVILMALPMPPPTVSSASPSSGSTAGGTSVTVTGSNFVSGASVSFGGVASASVTFVSSTQLSAVSPAHAAGAVNVVVTNPDLQFGTLVNGFTYVGPPPSVSGVVPNSGSTAGGTSVTVSGTGFVSGASVSFGGVASASVTFVSSTQLSAVSPAHAAGAVNVVVTNPDLQFGTLVNGFTYVVPPSVTSVNPSSGPTAGGTSVTISGANFVSTPSVTFGGVAASSVVWVSSTQLSAVSPAHAAGAVNVVATNPDGLSGTLVNGFTYVPPPTVSSFSPGIGPPSGGTSVTITGSNFVATPAVAFGGVASASVTFVSSTQLTAVTPASAVGYVTVRVTNPDGQSGNAPNQFLYRISPVAIGTVFVTSTSSNGKLGGLAGADGICQARADAGSFGGTWRAWLSTSTVNAKTRITDTTYRRLDNVIVANSLADLTDGSIANPINVANDGSWLGLDNVWTGTTAAGIYPGGSSTLDSCGNWAFSISSYRGRAGYTTATNSWWTYGAQLTCNNLERLYCFRTS